MTVPNDHFTPAQVATMLGVTVATLRQYRSNGKGPAYVHFGRSVFYPAQAITEYVATAREGKTGPKPRFTRT